MTLIFFIIFWTIVGFTWKSLGITMTSVKCSKCIEAIEIFILTPTIIWAWIKFGIQWIVLKLK